MPHVHPVCLASAASPLYLGQNMPYIRWALGHIAQLEPLVTDLKDIIAATTLKAKAESLKHAIDLVVLILDDFPKNTMLFPMVAATTAELDELGAHPEVGKNGQIIGWIIQNLPAILAFIQQIIPLFGGGKPA